MQGKNCSTPKFTRSNRRKRGTESTLPPIPDKRDFTIGEVALLCCVKTHVLRYWELEFSQLSPVKRRGNRRYYQREDVLMVRQIRTLLYENGFTIEGARAQLSGNQTEANRSVKNDAIVTKLIADLEDVLQRLKSQEGI